MSGKNVFELSWSNLSLPQKWLCLGRNKFKSDFYMENYLTLKIQILVNWLKTSSVLTMITYKRTNFKAVLNLLLNQLTIVLTIKIFRY